MYSNLHNYKNTFLSSEERKSPGLYWDRLEVAFKIFRFMGFIPYKVSDENDIIESPVQAWLWVGFASCVQVVVVVISDYMRCDHKYWDTYDSTLESLLRLLYTNNVIFILASWWESHKIIKYINEWNLFMNKLEKVTTTPLTCFSRHKFRKVLVCFAMIALAAVVFDQFSLQGAFNAFLLFSYFNSVYVSALITIFWAANCIFIVQVSRCFKNNLFIGLHTKSDPSFLDNYRLLWIQLRHNAVNLVDSFKGTIGLQIFINMLSLTFSTYSLMTALRFGSSMNRIFGFISPVLWNTITLIAICEFSDMVSQEVGEKLVSKMLNFTTRNYALKRSNEMDSLFDTLDVNPPDFELHGCFTINRSLLIQIFSSIITYLFVLIQFDFRNKK